MTMQAQLVVQSATRVKSPLSNFTSESDLAYKGCGGWPCRWLKMVGLIAPILGDRSMTSRSGRVFRVLNNRF